MPFLVLSNQAANAAKRLSQGPFQRDKGPLPELSDGLLFHFDFLYSLLAPRFIATFHSIGFSGDKLGLPLSRGFRETETYLNKTDFAVFFGAYSSQNPAFSALDVPDASYGDEDES